MRELWSFVHGDIMMGGLRQQLRDHLGLCDRHAWGHAVVEIELWEYGPGETGGHQPFDVAVLHEDLLGQLSARLADYRPSRRHGAERVLARRGTCRICSELQGAPGQVMGYAAQDTAPLVTQANEMAFTRRWLATSAEVWTPRICPACLAGSDGQEQGRRVEEHPAADGAARLHWGLLCRRHLLKRHELDVASAHEYAGHLSGLRDRLARHLSSMTSPGGAGTPATGPVRAAEERVAWIEALGWFAGWELPLALTRRGT